MTPQPKSQVRRNGFAPVEVVMAPVHPDGQPWKIPVTGSLVETKRILNSGDALVTLDVEGDDPIAVNPAHVAAIQTRRAQEVW